MRYELSPHDDGTTLVLTHSGVQREFYGRSAAGWHSLLDALNASIDGAPVPDFASVFPRVIDGYEGLARARRARRRGAARPFHRTRQIDFRDFAARRGGLEVCP